MPEEKGHSMLSVYDLDTRKADCCCNDENTDATARPGGMHVHSCRAHGARSGVNSDKTIALRTNDVAMCERVL